jgi:hypothetical protein
MTNSILQCFKHEAEEKRQHVSFYYPRQLGNVLELEKRKCFSKYHVIRYINVGVGEMNLLVSLVI